MFKKIILIISILFFFFLSLFGGPGYHQTRSLEALWNLGHVLLFALITLFLLKINIFVKNKKTGQQILIIVVVTLILGAFIELIQLIFNSGTPDVGDMGRNFIGSAIPLVFSRKNPFTRLTQIPLQIIVVLLVLFQLKPVVYAAVDEYRAAKEFPVLADFESPLELSRWDGGAPFTISTQQARHGKKALKIELTTELYSGVSLVYLPSDWSGYQTLHFNVFNPDTNSLSMTCRIHDKKHSKSEQLYSDRFNKHFSLQTGWNHIVINLDEVRNAPQDREMDMQQIDNFAIFATRLPAKRVIYLDYVYLEP